MISTDLCELSGAEQARLIREKKISPVELVDGVFDRIHRLNPTLNAFCTLVEDDARTQASAAETAVMRGAALG
ncbi:MAG TPA: amidase, partial [Chloroflexota bacterium]|nr:amidase [Chloroflexota bacterium]